MAALFAAAGVILVFLPRWLETERGLTGVQIGAVLALAQFGRIVTGPVIAHWAARGADQDEPLRLLSATALAAYAAFFFLADGFWPLLFLGFIALSLTQAMTPLVEAATLRATAVGKINYGMARGVGSIAFIIANVAGGALVLRFGLGAVVAWVLGSLVLLAASTWLGLQRQATAVGARVHGVGAIASLLRNRRFLILILACGLIQSAHGFYYGFSTLVWRGQGIPEDMISFLQN